MRKSKLKAYHLRLEEVIGERGNIHNLLIYAKDDAAAMKQARKYASKFYGDGGKEDEPGSNYWLFDFGAVSVSIDGLNETTETEFVKRLLHHAQILPRKVNTPIQDIFIPAGKLLEV